MAKYDPKRVLRQISNCLLRQLFQSLGNELHVGWEHLTVTQVEEIFAAWQSLDEPIRCSADLILQDVNDIASVDGVRAIIEEAKAIGDDELVDSISEMDSIGREKVPRTLNVFSPSGPKVYPVKPKNQIL